MARDVASHKRSIEHRTKVRTGCATCRVRKVKCDENKPFCQKCVKTGRACDGYETPFRFVTTQPANNVYASAINSENFSKNIRPTTIEITPQDIDVLSRYFSTKTLHDVKLDCDEEAKQILQASLTEAPIRCAVLSLRALREDLETSGDHPPSIVRQRPSYHYGIQQYSMALGGLASDLSSSRPNVVKSALLCCQIFISIEQVRKNWAAVGQHIIRGLRIMHEYRARPGFVAANKLVLAHHEQLPLLDVFLIKLFAAPCKFADPPAKNDESGSVLSRCSSSLRQQLVESSSLRTIAPNMRTELIRIAALALRFLDKVSRVTSVENALHLLSEKTALLKALESWRAGLEDVRKEMKPPSSEPVSVAFLRLSHRMLKIILLGALDYSLDLDDVLRAENDQLQAVANDIGERVKDYRTCSGTGSG